MQFLAALWLPILLSAVIVFIASSIMHMVLPYHKSDARQLPDEDKLMASLRGAGLQRGIYVFPYCNPKDMKSPAMLEKYKQGPIGMLTVFPPGPPVLPKFLATRVTFQLHCAGGHLRQRVNDGLSHRRNSWLLDSFPARMPE